MYGVAQSMISHFKSKAETHYNPKSKYIMYNRFRGPAQTFR